ncbi:helix-turn-helix transcriptional regulator [Phyllobacterium myrsinacearum]|uniref:DNA-binding CsgD family transcriptional regulator/PAS domain-containing protein n=1 Tax=Phyllobacterium myrsinacearum TaxID=28101 RepID=A0A839EPT4_9HYPH|nr:helix-turn-helix transcriptional regulator [Phyllobacterium myrsinacearum]MBA8879504.1 DNA-binding CsgD family transcriptional regulator/PAS domain-containing protein [Phyllobacterium myrsinacearum]
MIEATLAQITGLIGQIYLAAFDPTQWTPAIQSTRQLFNSSAVCLTNHTTNASGTWAFNTNQDEGYFRKYIEEHTHTNPYVSSLSAGPLHRIVADRNLFDVDTFRRSAFWNEWMKPQDMYDGLCCKLNHTASSLTFVDIRRGPNQPSFENKEADLFALLTPHFERASQINEQMRLASALTATFSRLPFGAVLVDADLRILELNDAAGILLEAGHAELMRRNGFLTTQSQSLRQLKKLVAEACGLHMDGLIGTGGRMIVETSTDAGQMVNYVLEVAPAFDSPFSGLTIGRCAIVIVKKIDMSNPEGLDEQIRAIFKLTPSEARLAVLLAGGLALKDAAQEAGLRNTTARAYLERLFHKTGTHQQSQLVALLKNAAPVLLRNGR